jgi:3-oxoacyl-[acyl-carrier-protein] synthase II
MVRRVAITGIGVVSPIGIGIREYWKSLSEGVSGIGPITRFDTTGYLSRIAGEVRGFVPEKFINRRRLAYLSRSSQFALACTQMALQDSGLQIEDAEDWAVTVGSGLAGFDALETQAFRLAREGIATVDPMAAPAGSCGSPAAALAIELGLHGEATTLSTACSSGLNALAYAYRQVQSGAARMVVTGGVETPIQPTLVGILSNGKVLSQQNELAGRASRPFDRRRDGYVIGEGAAFFIFEDLAHAASRGARIYAEVAGAGITCDAYSLLRLYEGGEYLGAAMKRAMYEATLNPEDIDHISAHGSSSPAADVRETRAIKDALGVHARRVWISAVKSMIGMALGAGGALQAAACALSIHQGVVPPTINYEEPDPECDLDYVPIRAREREVGAALVNSTGMGGTNVSLALRSVRHLSKVEHDGAYHRGDRRSAVVCVTPGGTVPL